MQSNSGNNIKWPEIFSLVALNFAVAISWIAYSEYQVVILTEFNLIELGLFLTVAKAIILVTVPPLAGLFADIMMRKDGNYFLVYLIGISLTAMVFMVVATLLGIDSSSPIVSYLPLMIVLWLVSMNIFVSPAVSLIEMFAPKKSLPIVMAVLVFFDDIVYALEPLVVGLVQFFGDTLTFVVGGILIISTGLFFYSKTKDEVQQKQKIAKVSTNEKSHFVPIIYVGILLGMGKGFLVEYLPSQDNLIIISGQYLAFVMLGLSALVAFLSRNYVVSLGAEKVLFRSLILIVLSSFALFFSSNESLIIAFSVLLSASFGLASITGIPFAISKLSPSKVTFGIGVFIGMSELVSGLFEISQVGGF